MTEGIALPSSLLALATTVHLCLALLGNHRSRSVGLLALISFAFIATPWVFPTTAGVALGLAGHAMWFVAAELFTSKRAGPAEAAKNVSAVTAGASRTKPAASSAPAGEASRPRGFVPVPILAVLNETDDIKTIRVARPEGFEFDAGQFVTVRLKVDGRELSRCYSISSAPDVRGYLEVSVKRQGLVSNALHAMARAGGSLSLRTPTGAFKYPSSDDRPIVLIAGGVGITPLMSMLRHAIAIEPARPVTLLYCARTERDFAFRDEITTIARRHPQARVFLAATRGTTRPEIYPGRINEALLRTTVPSIADSICCLCGPAQMIGDMKALLPSLGVAQTQIRSEVFEAAIAASAATAPERAAVPRKAARQGASALTCAMAGKQVAVRPGQTLLEAAEDGGVEIPSMCRAGVCGTCRVQVTDGDVDCDSSTLDADEQAQGYVLACVTTMRSNCTVEV